MRQFQNLVAADVSRRKSLLYTGLILALARFGILQPIKNDFANP